MMKLVFYDDDDDRGDDHEKNDTILLPFSFSIQTWNVDYIAPAQCWRYYVRALEVILKSFFFERHVEDAWVDIKGNWLAISNEEKLWSR